MIDEKNKSIHFLAANFSSGSGYNDLIGDGKYWNVALAYLRKAYTGFLIDFIDIRESSLLNDMEKYRPCVRINIEASENIYDSWFSRLSKSSRQNLRTAYNRMNTDGCVFEFMTDSRVDYSEKMKLWKLYIKRTDQINNRAEKDNSLKQSLKNHINCYFNIIFHMLNREKNMEATRLYINGKLAAFMLAYRTAEGIVIPKLSIDTDFSRYSPGCVMIAEYIKRLPGNQDFILDLSRGDEQYKLVLGGEKYYNFGYREQL